MTSEVQSAAAPNALRHEPPGPRGWPLLGHTPSFARDALGFVTSCARDHGDIVRLTMAGWPTLLLNHPDHLEYVFVKNSRNFIKYRLFWRHVTAIFGTGLLTSEGAFWQRQRRLAAPAFASQPVAGHGPAMGDLTARMLEGWSSGEVRDVHAEMMALTLRIAAKTLFSSEVEDAVSEIDHAVNDMAIEIASRVVRPFVIPDAVPLPGHLRYRRGLKRIDAVVDRIIAARRSRPDVSGDVLSMLMQARDDDGRPMSDRQLRDEVITLLLAGHETTALALSWTLHLLSHNPDADARVASELAEGLDGRCVTVGDLPRLAFTEAVLSEAMRLYPPAWLIGREPVADCEIGGYRVKAGTSILMSPWVIHRDARWFEDPGAFRPERWSTGFARQLPRFAYLPFGGGPRICIGKSFAMQEAMIILATMMQRFRFEPQPRRKIEPLPSITLRPKGGVWLKLAAR
jgi:cytochrome P450